MALISKNAYKICTVSTKSGRMVIKVFRVCIADLDNTADMTGVLKSGERRQGGWVLRYRI
jgi:hypothetical protein